MLVCQNTWQKWVVVLFMDYESVYSRPYTKICHRMNSLLKIEMQHLGPIIHASPKKMKKGNNSNLKVCLNKTFAN